MLVSRLADSITKDQLHGTFASVAIVDGVEWNLDQKGEQTGVACVVFNEQQHAEAALAAKENKAWKIFTVEIDEDLLKIMKDDQDLVDQMMDMIRKSPQLTRKEHGNSFWEKTL